MVPWAAWTVVIRFGLIHAPPVSLRRDASGEDGRRRAAGGELVERALGRGLVRAPAQGTRAVAEAASAHVVAPT